MSIALFPQERKSDNLVYVILPLGIVLITVALSLNTEEWFDGIVGFEAWLAFVSFLASFLALLLYMISPDEIIIRTYYRHLVKSRYKDNLVAHYRTFDNLAGWKQEDEEREKIVESMIGNAVSTGPISRRLVRVRSLGFFLITYPLYIISGVLLFSYVFGDVWNDFALVVDVFVIISGFVFGTIIYLSFVRHPLTRGIGTTMQFVAHFLYLRVLEGIYTLEEDLGLHPERMTSMPRTIRSVLDHMESILTRNDLDVFDIIWGNAILKKLASKTSGVEDVDKDMSREDVTFLNHQWALLVFSVSGFLAAFVLSIHNVSIPFLGLPLWPSLVAIWFLLGMVWVFRMSFYTRVMKLAAFIAAWAFAFAVLGAMRPFFSSFLFLYSSVIDPLLPMVILFSITVLITGIAIWETHLFAESKSERGEKVTRGWEGFFGIVLSIVGLVNGLVGATILLSGFGAFTMGLLILMAIEVSLVMFAIWMFSRDRIKRKT